MAEKTTKMIIKADLQCPCCYKQVKKILCKFPQIRDQVYNEKDNTVTITVVCCNPEKIRDKIYCKGGKVIKCIKIVQPKPPKPQPPPPPPPPPPEKEKPKSTPPLCTCGCGGNDPCRSCTRGCGGYIYGKVCFEINCGYCIPSNCTCGCGGSGSSGCRRSCTCGCGGSGGSGCRRSCTCGCGGSGDSGCRRSCTCGCGGSGGSGCRRSCTCGCGGHTRCDYYCNDENPQGCSIM